MSPTIDKIDLVYEIFQKDHYLYKRNKFGENKFCNIMITNEDKVSIMRCGVCQVKEFCNNIFGINGIPYLNDTETQELFERYPELKLIS